MTRQASFRDPAGQLFISSGRVLRKVNASGKRDLEAILKSPTARRGMQEGRIVSSRVIDPAAVKEAIPAEFLTDLEILLQHEKIFFPSYPEEWPPEMLHAAGCLAIELAESFLEEGMGLKDATPYNFLFQGPWPLLVDILSLERRDRADPLWLPQAQFERTFLLPLLVNRFFHIPLKQIFLASREGVQPEDVYRLCVGIKRFLPPFLTLVSLPVWLGRLDKIRSGKIYEEGRLSSSPAKALFILKNTFRRMKRLLHKNAPTSTGQGSVWSDYESENPYSPDDLKIKTAFIEEVMVTRRPRSVLDIGCNRGRFSQIAARRGARVVAIDMDPVVVGGLWRTARQERLDILPLVVNIADPTPATGWRHRERLSFLERAEGKFEAVFLLAILHHLLVTERIPLREIVEVGAHLTTDLLVIEFIPRDDPMFRQLCRGREKLYQWYDREIFERTVGEFFEIVQSVPFKGISRWLYLLRKRNI